MSYKNLLKTAVHELIKTGDLKIKGTAELFGELLSTDIEPAKAPTAHPYGFIGELDQYGSRENTLVNDLLEKWLKSPDEHERQAAALVPKRFVFIDHINDLKGIDETLFRVNHNKWLKLGSDEKRLFPFVNDKGVIIDNNILNVALGNFSFPDTPGREKYLEKNFDIVRWMTTILEEKARELSADYSLGLG